MRLIPIAFFLLIVPWHSFAQAQQTTDSLRAPNSAKCKIAGTVARQDTGEPLKKATVILRSIEYQKPTFAITDGQGHFEFADVEPGSYRLEVSHNGYLNSEYGQKKPGHPAANLSLAPGQSMTDLIFKLLRSASISGHVIDEDGEPLPRAFVRAFQRSSYGGKRGMGLVAWTSTNDLGEYRIFDLGPGRYFIRANYESRKYLIGITPSSPQMSKEDYPPTFYPNITDSSKASAITVKAGDEITAVDFILKPSPVVTVSGRVLSALTTQPDSGLGVSLTPRSEILVGDDSRLVGETLDKKGTFIIRNVFPGSYILRARLGDIQAPFSTRRDVDVGNSDMEGVNLTITPGVDVPGHFVWEQKPPGEVQSLRVALRSLDEGTYNSEPREVKPDGSFVIKNVSEGVYRPDVFIRSWDCYLESARYGLAEVIDGGLAIHPGTDASLELRISCRAAQIEGFALTGDALPAAGVHIVAIPDAPSRNQEWKYREEVTDQNGRFLLRGIVPGKYRIFSLDCADDFDWYDPEQLKPYESKGVSIEIQEGDKETLQLTVIEIE